MSPCSSPPGGSNNFSFFFLASVCPSAFFLRPSDPLRSHPSVETVRRQHNRVPSLSVKSPRFSVARLLSLRRRTPTTPDDADPLSLSIPTSVPPLAPLQIAKRHHHGALPSPLLLHLRAPHISKHGHVQGRGCPWPLRHPIVGRQVHLQEELGPPPVPGCQRLARICRPGPKGARPRLFASAWQPGGPSPLSRKDTLSCLGRRRPRPGHRRGSLDPLGGETAYFSPLRC